METQNKQKIVIDGSVGEGGGQILRSSLSLSLATETPFRIENIRAKRQKPGLLRQHLTAVQAAIEIGGGEAEGASLGSKTLMFVPGRVRAGVYKFTIGTAGSGTLVLQTVLPALMTANGTSHLTIEGGTHNPMAPPFDFLKKSFLPVIARLGPKITTDLSRYGFYPAGGGCFHVAIEPCERLTPIDSLEPGEIVSRGTLAIVANLSRSIGRREIETVAKMMNWEGEPSDVVQTRDSVGPGNVIFAELGTSTGLTQLFCGFGRLGASAEAVATEAANAARSYLVSGAAVDEHLADQLLLPFALAGGGSFTAEKLNSHARTNMDVITRFLPVAFRTSQEGGATRVEIVRNV
jgi:RNA 3'-terminal phosphate cyclase (ATP)